MLDGMDEWVGRIIEEVEKRGERDNTIIVYSADHGEMLGDHGQWNKCDPREPSVHVPLLVSGPGVQKGVQSDALVELIDLGATFLDLAGTSVPDDWDARTIKPVLTGEKNDHRQQTVSALDGWRMIFDGRFKYIEHEGRPPKMYDLQSDPNSYSCCQRKAS
ncbi:MAG: sulfatase [Planctomycetota bacterium]